MVVSAQTEADLLAAIGHAEDRLVAYRRLEAVGHECAAVFAGAEKELEQLQADLESLRELHARDAFNQAKQAEVSAGLEFIARVDHYARLVRTVIPETQRRLEAAEREKNDAHAAIKPTEEEIRSFKASSDGHDRFMAVMDDGYGNFIPPRPLIHNEKAPDANERWERYQKALAVHRSVSQEMQNHQLVLSSLHHEYPILNSIT